MTGRELTLAAIRHKETPKTPYHIDFSINERAKMTAYYNDPAFDRFYDYSLDVMDDGPFHEIKKGYFRDAFGVVWNRSGVDKDIGVIDEPLIKDIANYSYTIPALDKTALYAFIGGFPRRNPDRFQVFSLGYSLFERVWSLMTMQETLVAMIDSPVEMDRLLEGVCAYNLEVLDIVLAEAFDCVLIGDDWGQQKGMIMGAPHWRRFIKPCLKTMFDRIKRAGKIVALHSCGDIHEIFPELIDIGLDVYQTFQPEIYDIEKVKAEYGADLTFWGGISTQRLLPFASPEKVKSETIRIMRTMSKGGGYIAAPTHQVPGDIPPENIEALADVFIHQDRYL